MRAGGGAAIRELPGGAAAPLALIGCCCLGLLLARPAAAAPPFPPPSRWLQVRGLDAAEIARLTAQLGGPSEAQRTAAQHALAELHAESLPGIAQRLRELRRGRPDPEAAKVALTAFRHAAGSRRSDDDTDIARGVLAVLRERRDKALLAMAEPLLLLRSLERVATPEAGLLMADVLELDPPGVWDAELRRSRERVGLSLLPALIRLRSHADPRVRAWAQAGVHALGMDDPEVATDQHDAHLAAQVVRAYGEPLDFPAMPTVVRLVSSDKRELREAAREVTARFGKNAIWQLRELYAQVAGRDADRRWDAERTANELYALLDRDATEEADTLLAQGMARFVAGDLEGMRQRYDRLLARLPRYADAAKMAPGYAALGDARLARHAFEPAREAYRRALRLAPQAPGTRHLRAQLAFAKGQLELSHGVVDLEAYAQALRYEPGHTAAAAALDRLSGKRAARERTRRRLAAGAAIALLALLLVLLLRGRRGALPQLTECADDRAA